MDETGRVAIHYRRPPDRLQIFDQALLLDAPEVKVTFARDVRMERPLRIDGEVVLEDGSDAVWFTFPDAWHDIGRFHRADGSLTGLYANILEPCRFEAGGVWHTTDLFLDLWIPAREGDVPCGEPSDPRLLDAEELAEAEAQGWITRAVAARAREEAERLWREARAGRWPPAIVHLWTRERILGGGEGPDPAAGSGPTDQLRSSSPDTMRAAQRRSTST